VINASRKRPLIRCVIGRTAPAAVRRVMAIETAIDWNKWQSSGAIYGTSDKRWLFWGEQTRTEDPQTFPAVYSNDFFLKSAQPWTLYAQVHDSLNIQLETKIPWRVEWQEPDYTQFEKDFLWAQNKFKNGECTKIVLTTQTRAEKKYAPDVFLQNALGPIPTGTHLYGQWTKDKGFIGYTPEVLFNLEGDNLHTMALAGTSNLDKVDTHLYSEKNKREHQWVVDDLQTLLAPLGSIAVGNLQTLKLETLAHLKTVLNLKSNQKISLSSWIQTLHPTPALGTAPRSQWMQLEELRKGYGPFGAPFVMATGATSATALVGIRQLAWDEKYYYIRSGCGVVQDSQVTDEWNELLLKIKSVKKRFGWIRE
jgi:menaquinone-specific isochorismate synthase